MHFFFKTLLSCALAVSSVLGLRAELVEFSLTDQTSTSLHFRRGPDYLNTLSIGDVGAQPVSYQVGLSDLPSLDTMRGFYSGRFTIDGLFQTPGTRPASLTGSGVFALQDGAGGLFTGRLDSGRLLSSWNQLAVRLNMSDLRYTGSNPELLDLSRSGSVLFSIPVELASTSSSTYLNWDRPDNDIPIFSALVVAVVQIPEPGVAATVLALIPIALLRRRYSPQEFSTQSV